MPLKMSFLIGRGKQLIRRGEITLGLKGSAWRRHEASVILPRHEQ
jgi:hypothetical protein